MRSAKPTFSEVHRIINGNKEDNLDETIDATDEDGESATKLDRATQYLDKREGCLQSLVNKISYEK